MIESWDGQNIERDYIKKSFQNSKLEIITVSISNLVVIDSNNNIIFKTYNRYKEYRKLQEEPKPAVVIEVIVDTGRVSIIDVCSQKRRERIVEEERRCS